jgi:hypothetical protein
MKIDIHYDMELCLSDEKRLQKIFQSECRWTSKRLKISRKVIEAV